MNERDTKARAQGAIISSLVAIGCLVTLAPLLWSGCSASKCSPSTRDPSQPSSSIHCPGGSVCYQGECVETCNAGGESTETCESEGDCDSAGRPFCNNGFCSSCAAPDRCIPSLNVCSPILVNQADAGRGDALAGQANKPLDADVGSPPPIPSNDAGVDTGVIIQSTHTGEMILGEVFRGGNGMAREAQARLEVHDHSALRMLSPLTTSTVGGNCVLTRKTVWDGTPTPTDIGDVEIESTGGPDIVTGYPGSGLRNSQEITLEFNNNAYGVTAPSPLPSNIFVLSTEVAISELRVLSGGSAVTDGEDWPVPIFGDVPIHRVPAELCAAPVGACVLPCYMCISQATQNMFTGPISGHQTLDFDWQLRDPGNENNVGYFPLDPSVFNANQFIKMQVRVDGDAATLECEAGDTDGTIRVPLGALDAFRVAEGIQTSSGTTTRRDILFRRLYRAQVQVPINFTTMPPQRVSLLLIVHQGWQGEIEF